MIREDGAWTEGDESVMVRRTTLGATAGSSENTLLQLGEPKRLKVRGGRGSLCLSH